LSALTHGLADVLASLDLQRVSKLRFVGRNATLALPRVFGGQVLAQSLIAAGRTIPDGRQPHSLHGYFLRAGDPKLPIYFDVEAMRDGRSVSNRLVRASQDGRPIASVTLSFMAPGSGLSHQITPPQSPDPGDLPTLGEAAMDWGGLSSMWLDFDAIEIRTNPVRSPTGDDHVPCGEDSLDVVWKRASSSLPDDPLLHTAVLTFASDLTLLSAALVPHGLRVGQEFADGEYWDTVSMDHAMWFHRQVQMDDWVMFAQSSPVSQGGRALARAELFDLSGNMIATVMQEGLLATATWPVATAGKEATRS
jgi:acyl-CoA thioesterase-2